MVLEVGSWWIMIATFIGPIADSDMIGKVFICFSIDVTGKLPGFGAVGAGVPTGNSLVGFKCKLVCDHFSTRFLCLALPALFAF